MNERITRFMANGSGGRSLGLSVNGIRVSVYPVYAEEQEAAERLALMIAALGPEFAPLASPPAVTPSALVAQPPAALPFHAGERVRCIVHGAEGMHTVTEVGTGRNHGRIKVSGVRAWCPAGNFRREP